MKCQSCGDDYIKLGQHWAKSPSCDFPKLTDREVDIIEGLLMGDASVEDRGTSGRLSVQISNKEFLEWVDEELGQLTLGVKNYYTADEQKQRVTNNSDLDIKDHHEFDVPYELKSRSHPYFKELRSWYGKKGKKFPEELELTPLKAKIWYCCDGSLIKSENQRPHLRFYTKNERSRLDVLTSYFQSHGFDARKYESSVGFTADETERVLDWMGEPPAGMSYKWI